MMSEVKGFFEEYRFLSNFYHSPITVNDKIYNSVEHYYQASKAICDLDHEWIRTAPNKGAAKKRGRQIAIRKDWEEIKESMMWIGIEAKFTQNRDLLQKLLATGEAYLEETNYWGDKYWGVCKSEGKNRLGVLLMKLRAMLKNEAIIYGN